jgi:hypothetical protein
VVVGRLVHDIAQAQVVQPAGDEAEVIDGLTAVGWCQQFSAQAEIRPTPRMTPMPSRGCGMSDVKVRLFFPSLMCHAAMLQTMDPTDRDSTSSCALDPAACLTSLQKNPAETRPETP